MGNNGMFLSVTKDIGTNKRTPQYFRLLVIFISIP